MAGPRKIVPPLVSVADLQRAPLTRAVARVLVFTLLAWSVPLDFARPRPARATAATDDSPATAQAAGDTLYVNPDASAACDGATPCFTSIQRAIDAVGPGGRVVVQAGEYFEQLRIARKNRGAFVTAAERIVIEADPEAPVGSVVLRGRPAACEGGWAVEFDRSRWVTLRGFSIVGAGVRGIGLRGGSRQSVGIHIEGNRLARGGPTECNGGIDVGRGNPETVIANNLIYGNGRNGIRFRDGRGGSYYVVGNTIARNAWSGIQVTHAAAVEIANNVIFGNGLAAGAPAARVGVRRLRSSPPAPQQVRLVGNLICGNRGGELSGPMLDASDAGNLTPSGGEGQGVDASATCADAAALFADLDGADGQLDTADDDFTLAELSPAIDAGVDPRTLAYPAPNAVLESDFFGAGARPADGDADGVAAFDAGAIETPGDAEPTSTPSPTATASPTPTPTASPSPTPSPTATPSPTPTPAPNRAPTIVSTPVTRIVVSVPDVDPPEPSFDFVELTPTDVGSSRGDVFSTLPTTDPTVFGFTGSDVRKVNFDTTPSGTPLASGTQLTSEYASAGVLMSSIPISSGVFGGAASPPNATFIGPIGGQQSFTFTVPVVAVGIINTSPDQDRIAFYSPGGELMFSIRDQDTLPGPNFNVDRFVGARVTDSNLIGSIVFQNEAGNDEFDELIFEVSTAQLPRADYVYDCDATDPDLDTLEFSLLEGPPGMQVDPASGVVTWTPTSLDVGMHTVKIRVEDGRGGADEQEYQLEVVLQPEIPNVIGQTQDAAEATIEAAGFTVGEVTTQFHPTPAGQVFGQSPLGGTSAPPGTPVDIAVSLGPEPLPTPSPSPTPIPTASPPLVCRLGTFTVPGTANPWLAGMPDGATEGSDRAPEQSPTLASGLTLVAGTVLTFAATGCAHFGPGGCAWTPDALSFGALTRGNPNGIGGLIAQPNALVGVFLDDQQPNTSPAPTEVLDFRATALGLGFTELAPLLKQPFFIGDGRTGDAAGAVQRFTVPAGATRLFLGTQDGSGWFNNSGTITVSIDGACVDRPVARADAYDVAAGETLHVAAPGVLANDADPEGEPLTAMLVAPPTSGSVELQPDGSFTYVEGASPPPAVAQPLEPRIEWAYDTFRVRPASNQVMMAPALADVNGDGIPDVLFNTFQGSAWSSNGLLRAVSGAGQPLSTHVNLVRASGVTVSASTTFNASFVATRAIDGDLQTSWFTADDDLAPSFEIAFPGAVTVREVQVYGNREFPDGFDFLTGRLTLYDIFDQVVFDSGDLALPAPMRDVVIDVGEVAGVTKVRFAVTSLEDPGNDHGLAEIAVLGDGLETPAELWTTTDARYETYPAAGIAVGDIDLDGLPEIVALHEGGTRMVAFEHDGRFKWLSDVVWGEVGLGSASIADLDQDGVPEIVIGGTALNADGTLRWRGDTVGGQGRGANARGPLSVIADLDLDGSPEVVAGKSAYHADGSLYWNASTPDGLVAVANFDADGFPEIVVVESNVYLLEHDGTLKWGPVAIPGGGRGGAPTIADVDADGDLEIGVAGATRYVVYEGDGSVKWQQTVQDATSNSTGSSVYDFDGDGAAEVVYGDELMLRIFRGSDGEVLYEVAKPSATSFELPVVADVDADGSAEIVAAANNYLFAGRTGLLVVGGANGWRATRRIWNQHSYHVTNVNEDATIPRVERNNWQVPGLNHYRLNDFSPDDAERRDGFQYKAVDPGNLESSPATVTIAIAGGNGAPEITSTAPTTAAAGIEYTYAVVATDPDDGDTIVFHLVDGPPGMTVVRESGLVRWTPGAELIGRQVTARVRAQDDGGAIDVQTFVVTVASGPTASPAPTVTPTPTGAATATPSPGGSATPAPTPSPVRQLASIVVEPEDAIILVGATQPFTATGVFADGTSADLTAGVTWSSSAPAVATISAGGTATGIADGATTISAELDGVAGSTSLTVRAVVQGDTTPPAAAISSPVADAQLSGEVTVVGTATDANLLEYVLEVALAGDGAFERFAGGTAGVAGGALGVLDTSLLQNDLYTIRLRVLDRGGNETTTSVTVQVTGGRKVGNFTLVFEDVRLELSGLPITVTRVYDSRDKQKGDFGIGWRLELRTLRLRASRELGSAWFVNQSGLNYSLVPTQAHKVSLTLPNGKVEEFDLRVQPTSSFLIPFDVLSASFQARPGTLGSLESLDNNNLLILDAQPGEVTLLDDSTFDTYDPRTFRYTSAEGEVYVIDRAGGVRSLTDRNGNTLTIGVGGITHSSGRSVGFARDAQGRITSVSDPGGRVRRYAYDANGDLVQTSDFGDAQTRYLYDRFHGLLQVIDPTGAAYVRNEYDEEGRLVSTTDGLGRTIRYERTPGVLQEVIRDRLGLPTVYAYDADGNVVSKTDALGHVTTYGYDARGNLLSETDPKGRVASRTYDAANNLLSSTDFDGNTTTYTYNARNQVLTQSDAEGRLTTYGYDADGNLTSMQTPEGGTYAYTYDASGNQLTSKDPLGHVTQYVYDTFGQRTKVVDPLGNETVTVYDASGQQTSVTDATGETTTFGYDDAGRLTTTTDRRGGTTTLAYSSFGGGQKLASVADSGGTSRSFTYDGAGNLVRMDHGDGSFDAYAYDAEGRAVSSTDRDGRTTTFVRDALGRVTRTNNPDGTFTLQTWDEVGRLASRTDERGNTTTYAYAANVQVVTDPLGNVTTHEFDARGNRVETTDALGHVTTFEYDSEDRLVSTTFHDGSTRRTTYDLAGRRTAEIDQAGRVTTFGYDAAGRLTSVTNAAGEVTQYAHDALGRVITVTDARGNVTRFEYEAGGEMSRRILPLGQQETFAYDANGRRTSHTDFNGEVTTFAYDHDGRMVSKTPPGGAVVEFEYTPAGLRTRAGDDTATYDAAGRLASETKASGDVVTYGYDAAGNRTSVTTPEGTTTYTYDALDRLASVTDASGTTTYDYDAVGNLIETAYPNGLVTTYSYDALNRLVALENRDGSGLVSSYTYTLGAAGERVQVVEAGPATSGRTVRYVFDAVYRLVEEQIDEPGTANDRTITYDYDAVGNRVAKSDGGVTTTYTYDANDRLISDGTLTYGYDAAGQMTSRSNGAATDAYEFDAEGRLVAADLQIGGAPTVVTYAYDADGIRTAKTVNGATTTYVVDKSVEYPHVLVERTGGAVATYTRGLELVSQTRGALTSFYLRDGQGSTRQLTDALGAVTDRYTFDAFGVLISRTGASPNEFLYTGEQLDPNLGFYYLRARYYAQDLGRFVSMDPARGSVFDPPSLHRYLYAHADPVDNTDPSGRESLISLLGNLSIKTGLIGAGLGGGFTAFMLWKQGKLKPDKATVYAIFRASLRGFVIGAFPLADAAFFEAVLLITTIQVAFDLWDIHVVRDVKLQDVLNRLVVDTVSTTFSVFAAGVGSQVFNDTKITATINVLVGLGVNATASFFATSPNSNWDPVVWRKQDTLPDIKLLQRLVGQITASARPSHP